MRKMLDVPFLVPLSFLLHNPSVIPKQNFSVDLPAFFLTNG